MTTLIFTHEVCVGHHTGDYHPESPDRLRAVHAVLDGDHFRELDRRKAPRASRDDVALAHEPRYVDNVLAAIPEKGHRHLDPDTVVSPESGEAALRGVGAVVAAIDAVVDGQSGSNAFCAVRPPGHHAERARSMGFCLFNNVAVGALHARVAHGLQRAAVVDFDVHHGNGTEDILRKVEGTAFFSIHQHPAYPGTGTKSLDNCYNYPVPPDSPNASWRKAASQALKELKQFGPDLICVSAGFDAYKRDPLCQQKLEIEDFTWIAQQLRQLEKPQANLLEGGYSNDLPKLIFAYLKGLMK